MGLVVSFAGRIGSGKTSVTAALAKTLGWQRASFGDHLRAEIVARGGDPGSREALQELGQSLVDSDPEAFCWAVLASVGYQAGSNLLVDGVRHIDIHSIIRSLVAPSEARLVFLAAEDDTRAQRVSSRLSGLDDLARAEQHRVEAELKLALPSAADAVLSSDEDLTRLIERCRVLIARWQSGGA